MTKTAFGTVLKRLRENKGLSLRDVSHISGLDHAYVYRLEIGAKESPSDDALTRLCRGLRPSKRLERILRFLVGRNVPLTLVDSSIVDNPDVAPEDFESAAQMKFRGKETTGTVEWRKVIIKIRQLREELEGTVRRVPRM